MSEMIKDQKTSSEHENVGRRRLVRGALAFAPLVLTLRSGALAAASCTGVKLFTTPNPGNGKITPPIGTTLVSAPGSNEPDKCVLIIESDKCGTNKIVTSPIYRSADVTQGQQLQCGSSADFKNQQVAILSFSSANSLTGVTR